MCNYRNWYCLPPEITVEAEVERGDHVALPWQNPDLHVYTQMLWHKDKWLSPIILSFIEAAKEVLAIKAINKSI